MKTKMEWTYLLIGLFTVLLLIGIFSGCSVVKTNYSKDLKKEATVYYYLPESILKIRATAKVAVVYNADSTLTGSSNIIEESFAITTEMIADTKDLLSLKYKPNALMADEIKYAVNSKGLLETVNITTEDRTADIISKLVEAPQIILGTSAGDKKATKTIVKIKEFTSDFVLKASIISSTVQTIKWNLVIYNELGIDEQPQTVPADFALSSPDAPTTPTELSNIINGTSSENTEIDGILTRPIKYISLKIESALAGVDFNTTLPSNVVIADVTKLVVIPVNRTAFVKRTNKIGIQDGIILSNEITKPSSVEGFISIPINIAKAIVSIPSELVQFKFDNTKKIGELEKAQLEIEKTNLSNSIELQKSKLELQTTLLEAEKKQLINAQKELDEIKKQLEELKQKK